MLFYKASAQASTIRIPHTQEMGSHACTHNILMDEKAAHLNSNKKNGIGININNNIITKLKLLFMKINEETSQSLV